MTVVSESPAGLVCVCPRKRTGRFDTQADRRMLFGVSFLSCFSVETVGDGGVGDGGLSLPRVLASLKAPYVGRRSASWNTFVRELNYAMTSIEGRESGGYWRANPVCPMTTMVWACRSR